MALSLTPANQLTVSKLGSITLTGSEISAFDPVSDRFFVTTITGGLAIVNGSNPSSLSLVGTVDFTAAGFGFFNDVNSVAAKNGVIAVAVANTSKTDAGRVFLLDSNGSLLKSITVGANPDMLTFTPDGKKILVVNEGERSLTADAKGSVSIIDITGGAASATVTTAGFEAFDGKEAALRAAGVRIYNGKSASDDLEPEYIAVAPDGKSAMVTLQEANAVGLLDLTTGRFTDVVPLGLKSWKGLLADFSDRDSSTGSTSYFPRDGANGEKVFGMYMPDAIGSYSADGKTYYVTANEGDDRNDFITGGETTTLSAITLDSAKYGNISDYLKSSAVLGRLTVPNPAQLGAGEFLAGDKDGDGDVDTILTYGGRSFSILDSDGKVVFDSGDHIERFIATQGTFSSSAPATSGAFDDTRSDNKGPEPEGVVIASVSGHTLAFIGLERGGGGAMVYDVTDPKDVQFVAYARNAADVSPEGLLYISAADSPTGQALLVTSNELTGTLTTFGVSLATVTLGGTARNDVITGTFGIDVMTGDAGKDRFVFKAADDIGTLSGSRDRITDFVGRSDRLDLRQIDANETKSGNQAFKVVSAFGNKAGDLVIDTSTVGSRGLATVSGDTDGDGRADFVIELTGVLTTISAKDIML